jgi:hypothetical protein
MRIYTSSKQYSSRDGFEASSSRLNLHAVRQDSTGLTVAGWIADAVLSSRFKPEMMKLIQSKHIFTAKYMTKTTFIFNDTFLIRFAGKCCGQHTKNNKQNYFTEFFKYKNHKRSESLCGIFQYIKIREFFHNEQTTIFLNIKNSSHTIFRTIAVHKMHNGHGSRKCGSFHY